MFIASDCTDCQLHVICSSIPHVFDSLFILFLRELLSPPDCNNGTFVRILTAAARMWHQSHAKATWPSITALLLDSTKEAVAKSLSGWLQLTRKATLSAQSPLIR